MENFLSFEFGYIFKIYSFFFFNKSAFLASQAAFLFFFFYKVYVCIILNFYFFIYLFLAVLGLCFCARAFSSGGKWGPLFITVRGPLTIAASLVAEHRLQSHRLSSCGSRA